METENNIPDSLSAKQMAFCNEYVLDFNATQAAIRAGYSARTAAEQSSRLLTNVKVQEYLQGIQQALAAKHDVTKDIIATELKHVGKSDIRKLFDENGCIKNIQDLDDATAAAISSIEIDEILGNTVTGKVKIGETKKIKFWPKVNALDSLSKMLGFNAPEKLSINYEDLTDAQLDHIIEGLKKAATGGNNG